MDLKVEKFINEFIEFNHKRKYLFSEVCGFTFAFKEEFAIVRGNVTSAMIEPVGIIYEENGEYFFAPLAEMYELDEIIKEYVNFKLK